MTLQHCKSSHSFYRDKQKIARLSTAVRFLETNSVKTTNPNLNGYNASGFADTEVCRAAFLSE